MNCQDGKIHQMTEEEKTAWEKQNNIPLAPLNKIQAKSLKHRGSKGRKRFMKHQPCPCGSKKKFLACCWHMYT